MASRLDGGCLRRPAIGVKAGGTMNRLLPLLLALSLPACHKQPSAPPPLAGARIGGPFALVDGNGRPFTQANLRGQYALVYFGYTFCPDVCPTDMAAIGAGLKQVEQAAPALGAKVVPIFVSVDPERDTPAVVKRFAPAFHPRAIGLTGSPAAVKQIAKGYGVFYGRGEASPGGGYMVNHSRVAYLMGPDGQPIAMLEQDQGPDRVAAVIRQWVT
jgi:protein SCO1/2